AGVTNQRPVRVLGLECGQVHAAVVAQVAVGEGGGHGGGEVVPGQQVDVVGAVGRDRRWCRRHRRYKFQWPGGRDGCPGDVALLESMHRIDEGESVQSADELDDVAANAAAEAFE